MVTAVLIVGPAVPTATESADSVKYFASGPEKKTREKLNNKCCNNLFWFIGRKESLFKVSLFLVDLLFDNSKPWTAQVLEFLKFAKGLFLFKKCEKF